jgi:hypothetical protein
MGHCDTLPLAQQKGGSSWEIKVKRIRTKEKNRSKQNLTKSQKSK